jgi:hypothetical protein
MNKIGPKTIMIAINQGFGFRYLIQTDVFKFLQSSGNRIILLVPNSKDKFYENYKHSNVELVRYQWEACQNHQEKHPIERKLRQLRQGILNGKYNIQTVKGIYQEYIKNRENNNYGLTEILANKILDILVSLCRQSKSLRQLILWIEQKYYTPLIHQNVFNKYQPDILIVSSLGTFMYDQYLIREARHWGTKVLSIILSWDNTTTHGMAAAVPDQVIAWTENMKKELVELHDIPKERIFVGGVAHFDHYYKEDTFLTKKQLCDCLKLDPNKKLLFFVTKSPSSYPWNSEIAEIILQATKEKRIDPDCQLLVRIHPLYYTYKERNYIHKIFLDMFNNLQDHFPELIINRPVISSEKMNYSMPKEEIDLLASILKHSAVIINMFSTLNLEASIFDKPMVNVSFEGTNYNGPKKARYNIAMDEAQTHNQRVVLSGAVQMVRSPEELVEGINLALKHPDLKMEARRTLVEQECGPFPGTAGKNIAKHILHLLDGLKN